MQKVLLVKYGEIALRGKNRGIIEKNFSEIIIKTIKKFGEFIILKEQGRLVVECKDKQQDFDFNKIIPLIVNIFGVSAVCPAIKIFETNIEQIKQVSLKYMQTFYAEKQMSFKVETKRSDKRFPMQSRELSSEVGSFLLENIKNLTVNVHNPDVILTVEIRNFSYIYSKIIKGLGGLPLGTSGKATLLMSGGIDSPVAGFMLAKRGVSIEAVYFDSPPYTSERAKQKVIDLAKQLSIYTGSFKLNIINFTKIQLKIYDAFPAEKTTIFMKRAMFKIAEQIAKNNGSQGLITGDSIGQVASQTMQAIDCINSAVLSLPVFRPLCGMDKQEIVDLAKKIGTFDISIRPFEDCCTIFVAKHPELKPKKHIIEKMEKREEGFEQMFEDAINNIHVIEF